MDILFCEDAGEPVSDSLPSLLEMGAGLWEEGGQPLCKHGTELWSPIAGTSCSNLADLEQNSEKQKVPDL